MRFETEKRNNKYYVRDSELGMRSGPYLTKAQADTIRDRLEATPPVLGPKQEWLSVIASNTEEHDILVNKGFEPYAVWDGQFFLRKQINGKNKLLAQKTLVTTSRTRIVFPTVGRNFEIYHASTVKNIWLGNEGVVSVSGATSMPLMPNMRIPFEIEPGVTPDIFGRVSLGTEYIYVIGTVKEAIV